MEPYTKVRIQKSLELSKSNCCHESPDLNWQIPQPHGKIPTLLSILYHPNQSLNATLPAGTFSLLRLQTLATSPRKAPALS